MSAKINFKDKNIILEVDSGVSILDVALDHGIPLYHTCGGNASCSTCRVIILKGAEQLSPIESAEEQVLDSFDLKPPYRLACQSILSDSADVEVEIPSRDKAPRPNKTPKLP